MTTGDLSVNNRRAVSELFSEPILLRYLLALWMISIFGSARYLSPGVDDGLWVQSAVAFAETGKLAYFYGSDPISYYHILPAYPFATGVFYSMWLGLGLPLDVSTYKVFHLLTLAGTIWAAVAVLRRSTNDVALGRVRAFVFLAFLGVMPFAMDAFYPRPEALGFFATLMAVLAFGRAINPMQRNETFYFGLSGLCLGVAATCHPSFVFAGLGAVIVASLYLKRHRKWKALFLAALLAIIPVGMVALWIFNGWPDSWQQLMTHVDSRASHVGKALIVSWGHLTLSRGLSMATGFYFIFHVAFWVVVVATLTLVCRVIINRQIGALSPVQKMVLGMYAMAMVQLVQDGSGRVQIFTSISFYTLLAGVALIGNVRGDRVDQEPAT